MMKKLILNILMLLCLTPTLAQQYTGMSGLIHVPSADMDEEGVARVGSHFMNKMFTPDETFRYNGEKFNTADFYLSVTPFKWIEIGYTFTLRKRYQEYNGNMGGDGYYGKDRYFSLKVQLLKEKDWYPSIAIGTNDPYTTSDESSENEAKNNSPFRNYYIAVTKHVELKGHSIGFHVAGRYFKRTYNHKWNGVVGGLTYSPPIDNHHLRSIVEYTGDDINVGADYLLFNHFMLQVSLQRFKYFSGGLCYQLKLF